MAPGEVNAAQCERRGIMGQRIDVPRAGLVGEVPFLVDCCLEDWLVADRSHHADPRLLRWGGLLEPSFTNQETEREIQYDSACMMYGDGTHVRVAQ